MPRRRGSSTGSVVARYSNRLPSLTGGWERHQLACRGPVPVARGEVAGSPRWASAARRTSASTASDRGFRYVVAGFALIVVGAIVAVPKGNHWQRSAQVVGLVAGIGLVIAGIVLLA